MAAIQRRGPGDKKAFINEQCIKLEATYRRRKNRDLFMKIGNIKGAFWPQMSTVQNSNGRDLVDAEEIKKRWKVHTEELYDKEPNEPDYHDGVVSHPGPDTLE